MNRTLSIAQLALSAAALSVSIFVQAADVVSVQSSSIQTNSRTSSATTPQSNLASQAQIDQLEQLQAKIWGLNIEEVRRANWLMKGPRGSFSLSSISPIEVLGIHARNDAERRKYAEMFARALHADTEKVLAWANAHAEAMARLYPNEKVVNFTGAPYKPVIDPAIAEAALVPESAVAKPVKRGVGP